MLLFPITSPAQTATAEVPGISAEKPSEGPSVKVDEGYMVPYTFRVPGTDKTVEMIPVPGGEYLMGSPESEADRRDDEGPQIKVTVDPMWVSKTEVTWGLYKEYMNLYGIFKQFESSGKRPVDDSNKVDAITAPTELYDPTFTYEYGEEPNQPAVTMTQYAAQQFTKWLSLITGNQYRLPTEAEWEYAARGGTKTAYSWGDESDDIDDYSWYFDNADEGQVDVASKKPNPFGLYDMHGNVAEWTVNAYTENGYEDFADKAPLNATDAVVWPDQPSPCVVRGGSWEMDPEDLRSAARLPSDDEEWKSEDPNFPRSPWWFTSDPARGVGFRIFRSYKPLPKEKISKFWEAQSEDVMLDVQSRLDGGRGGLGLVDPELPKVIEAMKQ
ncbi:formylglycine-generating enzyme family protein [Roseiconus nitratireducens]|uniref:Formylglycine-generating enzyme family protein n=1 Tax=Roseiconus nitratireducens TaxID=2605748 RepID=A0A5M6DE53_9BACT|nr:SUMF1/EgtB/PvdO family nonheme iron enzyme [Roseiconus nitratireducens]KAA5544680.1 formylglycine-generating enzyme family protein [Roseiconus nitratireducens]